MHFVTVAAEQTLQFTVRQRGQYSRIRDLVSVQMQNRKDRAIAHRIQKLVGVPTGGARSGLGFAVSHYAAGDQVGIIEHRAVSMQQAVTEFPALMNRSRRFRRDVPGNAARKGELLE